MSDRPDTGELVEAVREFLEREILPTLADHRLKFRTLVAMNALAIARRDLTAEADLSDDELRELARRIRAGDVPDGALALLRRHVEAKLLVASPRYLERYR